MERSEWTLYFSLLGAFVCVAGGLTSSRCGALPAVEGATAQGDASGELGAVVNYMCDIGYLQRGSRQFQSTCELDRTSGAAKWTDPSATCIPNSCGDPGLVLHADRVGDLFTFPHQVDFRCAEGYILRGQGTRFCQANGEWSGELPDCEELECERPEDPEHGRVSFTSLAYGATLRYSCDPGFVLSGSEVLTCSANGSWSHQQPACVESRCEAPVAPLRGTVQVLDELIRGNSLAVYACQDGWTLEGASVVKCLLNGKWAFPAPECKASCVVPSVPNGDVGRFQPETRPSLRYRPTANSLGKLEAGEIVEHGGTVDLLCSDGYSPAKEGVSRALCENGTWTETFKCEPSQCLGEPPPIQHGRAVVYSRSQGHVLWYSCNRGYAKGRTGHVQCVRGSWKGHTPLCVDGKGRIRHNCYTQDLDGTGLAVPSEEYVAKGGSFRVTCAEGFQDSGRQEVVSCRRGVWQVPKEACIEVAKNQSSVPHPPSVDSEKCTYLNHDRTLVAEAASGQSLRHGDFILVGDSVLLRCRDPSTYQLWPNGLLTSAGPVKMICSQSGRWEAKHLPSCVRTQPGVSWITWKGDILLQPGGSVEVKQNENVTIYCHSLEVGYPTWNTPVFLDLIYSTGLNGSRRFYATNFVIPSTQRNHVGKYSCSVHDPNGKSYRTSIMDLQIEGKITCPRIQQDGDLIIMYKDLARSEDSVSEFSCKKPDQRIAGPRSRTCQRDGTWSEGNPTCVDITCSPFPKSDWLDIAYTGDLKPLSFARFECAPPTTLKGDASSMCLFNGSWTNPPPTCSVAGCLIGELMESVPENLIPDMEGVVEELQPVGSSLAFLCEQDLILAGGKAATCGSDGKWDVGKAECVVGCRFSEAHLSAGALLVEPLREFYRLGEFALLACPEGLQLASPVQRLMCVGRHHWSDPVPTCREENAE